MNELFENLNSQSKKQRLEALRELRKLIDIREIILPKKMGYTNNHVHTTYSFSPYSPAKAVWMAANAGLSTVGIMDHDAINGAEEFIEAGKIMGIATTIGFEIRTDWSDTKLGGRRLNNPDQLSNGYITAHGIPHHSIEKADEFLSGVRQARGIRNKRIVGNINRISQCMGISLNYEDDVLPLSNAEEGGGVTERHILFALTLKMIKKYGRGSALIDVLKNNLNITLGQKQLQYLQDTENGMYSYDLLNVLKSSFIKDIYVDADSTEAVPVKEAVDFIKSIGAIPSYCYLGDVGKSPTGDKKEQKFEDDYLEEVLKECKAIGFDAIAYMPSRNTMNQLERVIALCEKYNFMQISGEDINQPRQSFVCEKLSEPEFAHLIDTTWALVGHELAATQDIENGMFYGNERLNKKELCERIEKYKKIGLSTI